MNFGNLKIGSRLAIGFGALTLFLIVVSGLAVMRIHAINHSTGDILHNAYAKVDLSTSINSQVNVQARFLRDAIVGASDPKEVEADLAMVQGAIRKNNELMAKLEPMVISPEGKELLATMVSTRNAYGQARDKTIELVRSGKGDEAGAYLLKEVRPPQNAFFTAADAMVSFQQKKMEDEAAQAERDGRSAIQFTVILTILAIGTAVAVAWMTTRSITRPIQVAVQLAETVAAGDLTTNIVVATRDETGQLLGALKRMNESLQEIVGNVRQASDSIATGTTQIASGNADLSQRTEEQASNLQQTAASMEQMTATVQKNAEAANQARQLSTTASEAASKGGEVVNQVVATMAQISESSRKISDIIGTIDGIAFQTNILALNAAVEAARAGEQGRGFAVVASEVRSLAQRSAQAAREIKSLINDSVEKVEAGSALVGDAGHAIQDIMLQVSRVNDLVGEISAASTEQNQGIGQIGDAVHQLDQVTQQNAALVEESAAAAESLKYQAAQLAETVSKFRVNGDGLSRPATTQSKPTAQVQGKQGSLPGTKGTPVAKPAVRPVSAKAISSTGADVKRGVARTAAKPARSASPRPVTAPSTVPTNAAMPTSAEHDSWETF